MKTRVISLLLTLALLLSLGAGASAVFENELDAAVSGSAAYMRKSVKEPTVASIGGEWAVLGLARSGAEVPQEYWENYYAAVEEKVEACQGVLHKKKYTDYSRVILALTAIGADPSHVAGYNLLTPLGDFDKTIWQGINGPIWALIALDSGSYEMPVNTAAATQATRQMYVDEILSRQLDCGGWNLTAKGGSGSADPDITGMALQALAKYQQQSRVKTATDKALAWLSQAQDNDGGYASSGTTNSESVVQVIVALCELGISLEDGRFVKNGNTLLDNLLSYRLSNGSFRHTAAGSSGSDQMASEQGFYGMVAALRAAEGKNSLYRMGDTEINVSSGGDDDGAAAGRHADVKKASITAPGTTFTDIKNHADQTAIEKLAERGIITGMGDDTFAPDKTMTRAQFAAIVVRALGLPQKTTQVFTDVAAGKWYAPYIGSAYAYGIVNGKSAASFDPEGTITRQEAAAMVARAAKLCGMDTSMTAVEIRNMLAQFGDYVSVADWAQESTAFCYSVNILDQSDWDIEPKRPILRCEIAQMLYQLLINAELL